MKTIKIYCLVDPVTGQPKYVGRTIQSLEKRKTAHILRAKKKTMPYIYAWIKGLLNKNLQPQIILLEEVDKSVWEEKERYWIKYFKINGIKLTNMTTGGCGTTGYCHKKETKERWSKERRGPNHPGYGKKRTLDQREKMSKIKKEYNRTHSNPLLGRKRPLETILKMIAGRKDKPVRLSESGKLKKSLIMKERWSNPIWRQKMRLINTKELMSGRTKNCWKRDEYRLKNSGEARSGSNHPGFGKKFSSETKEKMRIAALRREQSRCMIRQGLVI